MKEYKCRCAAPPWLTHAQTDGYRAERSAPAEVKTSMMAMYRYMYTVCYHVKCLDTNALFTTISHEETTNYTGVHSP